MIKRGGGGSDVLILDRVSKNENVNVGDTIITAGTLGTGALPSMFPRGIPVGSVTSQSNNDVNAVQEHPGHAARRLLVAAVGDRPRAEALMDGVKAALVLFVVALLQLVGADRVPPFRTASIVLVALLSVALLRGSVFGAVAGFGTGLLLDIATLGTLGVTSLLLTVAGFWIGRYGETTARDRFHAPFLSVAVVTGLYAFGQVALQFVLGEPAPAGLVAHGLPLALLVNLLLTLPVYALIRRLFPPLELGDRVREVRLLG